MNHRPETDPLILAKSTVELETGIRMAYLEAGPPKGEAVIVLHGITDSSRTWSRSMAAMHARRPDLRLFALDQRGHGSSSDRKSTRLNSSHIQKSRMPSSA